MSAQSLEGRRILIAEDEYMLADDLAEELAQAGASVIGPAGSVEDALSLFAAEPIDAAILDINLRGEMIYSLADWLGERRVPFVFATGYDASAIPERFDQVIRCEKPIQRGKVTEALGSLF